MSDFSSDCVSSGCPFTHPSDFDWTDLDFLRSISCPLGCGSNCSYMDSNSDRIADLEVDHAVIF